MDLYLVRHGIAVNRRDWHGADAERPLTEDGKEKLEREAAGIARLGLSPEVILTSPYTRAHATAEIIARRLEMMDRLELDERLGYGFGRKKLSKILADHADAHALMLVGHEPDFGKLIGKLTGGGRVVLDKGALAYVALPDADSLQGELHWLLHPPVLFAETMEIEAKFILPDRETLERLELTQQLAGLTLAAPRPQNVRDVYRDTPGRLLFAAGYFCRERQVDGQVLVTVKSLAHAGDGMFQREELEVSTPAGTSPAEWPASPARTRVLAIVGAEPLAPWFELRQTRLVRPMFDGKRSVGELSLDDICVTGDGKTLSFLEVEAERQDTGTPEDVETIAACLKNEWQLQPEPHSKFERALEFLKAAPRRPRRKRAAKRPRPPAATAELLERPGIQLDDSMAEAARKTLDFQFRRVQWNEDGARTGQDPEAVHDMRVATRRMRAALRVMRGEVDRKALKPYAAMLRRTGRALGPVRDLEVFRDKTDHYIQTLPEDRRTDLDPLLNVWNIEYARAREDLLTLLDGDAYRRFKDEFGALLEKPGALELPDSDEETRPTRVAHVLPGLLFESLARVRAYEDEMSRPDVPLVRYHQLRIASKGLRYTLEFFQEVLGPAAQDPIEQVKQLQEHLGNLQDAVVTCNLLRDFLVWGTWRRGKGKRKPVDGIVAPGVALYLSVRQQDIQALVNQFPPVWAPIASPEFTRQLAALIAGM